MAGTLSNGMCRCCASEGAYKDISSKYVWMGEEEVYVEMLQECFNINLANVESEDGGICEVCITQLRNAFNFKKQVQHTEEQFNKRLNDTMFKTNIVKVEISMLEEENHHSDNNDHNLSDEYSGPEFEVPVKTEVEETKGKKRTRAAATRAKKAKANESAEPSKRKKIKKPDVQYTLIAAKNRENLKTILLHSNASLIKSKTDKGYSCYSCPKLFQKPDGLKQHFLQEHRDEIKTMKLKSSGRLMKIDITNLKCNLCAKSFENIQSFTNHLPEHNLNFHLDVENQIIPLRFDSDAFKCAVCESEFVTFNVLLQHTNGHFSNIKCEECGAGFVIISHYLRHKDKHEKGEYKCSHCDKTFNTKNNRNVHEKITHLGIKKNKCSICSKRFSTHWTKISHMVKEHGESAEQYKIECNACDKVFSNTAKLRTHVKFYHLMIGHCVCLVCNKPFNSKNALAKHTRTHQREKMFECDICGKRSVSKNSLKEHIRTHSNGWRYSCSVCNLGFAQSAVMKAHMATKKHKIKVDSIKL